MKGAFLLEPRDKRYGWKKRPARHSEKWRWNGDVNNVCKKRQILKRLETGSISKEKYLEASCKLHITSNMKQRVINVDILGRGVSSPPFWFTAFIYNGFLPLFFWATS